MSATKEICLDPIRDRLDVIVSDCLKSNISMLNGMNEVELKRLIRGLTMTAIRSLEKASLDIYREELLSMMTEHFSYLNKLHPSNLVEISKSILSSIAPQLQRAFIGGSDLIEFNNQITYFGSDTMVRTLYLELLELTQESQVRERKELNLLNTINQLNRAAFAEDSNVIKNVLEHILEVLEANDGVIYIESPAPSQIQTVVHKFGSSHNVPQQVELVTHLVSHELSGGFDPTVVSAFGKMIASGYDLSAVVSDIELMKDIVAYIPIFNKLDPKKPQNNLDVEDPNPLLRYCIVGSYITITMQAEDETKGLIFVNKSYGSAFTIQDYKFIDTMCNSLLQITENINLNAKLERMAITDGLTEVFNHRHFKTLLVNEFRRGQRYGSPLSMAMIDIDHFKKFNDKYGHSTGDFVLKEVCRLMKSSLRSTEIVARYGGEEFAILFPETGIEGAQKATEKLRALIESTVLEFEGNTLHVNISAGVSSFPVIAQTETELINTADEALYRAKNSGRNRVCVYGRGELK